MEPRINITDGIIEKKYDHNGRDNFIDFKSVFGIIRAKLTWTNKCNDRDAFFILTDYHRIFKYNHHHNRG